MATKRAAFYARFSSDLQKDASIDDQFAMCRRVVEREGARVVETFHDRALSGATMFERDGLLAMMQAAKRKAFDMLVVDSLDRLSRDQEDLPGLFKRLQFYGIELRTPSDGVVTKIHVGIRGITGSLFLDDLARNVRRGHNGLVRAGRIPGAVAYGYRRVRNQLDARGNIVKGLCEIEDKQAAVVRRIFREYAAGVSPRAIAAGLNRDGIPSPDGGIWNHQTFVGGRLGRGMIGNPIYIGHLVWGTTLRVRNPDTGKRLKRVAPADNRTAVDVPHLRIIDQDLWDAANGVRQDRARHKFGEGGKVRRFLRASAREHLLSGLLRCGACQGHMRVAQVSRDGAPRVTCAAAHQHGTCEHRKSYDLDKLQAGVLAGLRDMLTDPEAIAREARAFHKEYAEREKKIESIRAAFKSASTRSRSRYPVSPTLSATATRRSRNWSRRSRRLIPSAPA